MGCNTPEADAVGMGYTDDACCGDKVRDMMRFLRERQGENKGDERGSARRGRRAGGRVTKRRKEGGEKGGVRYGERRCRVESRPDARKRKSAQCTRTASAARCRSHARTGS